MEENTLQTRHSLNVLKIESDEQEKLRTERALFSKEYEKISDEAQIVRAQSSGTERSC